MRTVTVPINSCGYQSYADNSLWFDRHSTHPVAGGDCFENSMVQNVYFTNKYLLLSNINYELSKRTFFSVKLTFRTTDIFKL